MPRVSPLRQLDRARLTPFAQIVYDYLMGHYVLVSELAEMSGVSNNAIWSWLKHGILPRRQTIVQLAERARLDDDTPAFEMDELLLAAGLPTTAQMQRERVAHIGMLQESIDEVMATINADAGFTPEQRSLIEARLRRLPEEFVAATNTYAEWRHTAPMDWQMRRSEERAAVFAPEPITSPDEAHNQPPRNRHRRGHERQDGHDQDQRSRHTTQG